MQHSLNKHKKKRFNPYSGDETLPEFQVAPMVDVLLVLLLFFMATATLEVAAPRAKLQLPRAEDSKAQVEHAGQSVIDIQGLDFKIFLDGKAIQKPGDLVPYLRAAKETDRELRRNDGGDYRLLIRADKQTPYSLVKEIMQASSRAGISNVTFAVVKGGEAAPPEK